MEAPATTTGTAAATTLEAPAPTAMGAATSTLEAPAACRSPFSAPARGAARARVTHLATPPKSLERICLSASPGAPEATSLGAAATALR